MYRGCELELTREWVNFRIILKEKDRFADDLEELESMVGAGRFGLPTSAY
jgi:hypothetical protein